ncbi:HAD family hydrolase [Streptomyces sp. NPDC097727]|uniref:HAD family hydrolase n=1 Tax=Streptomyces sp. NPDC097727 TaxID=3366092 RepID=UPI003801EC93
MVLGSLGDHWFTVTLAAEDTERTKPDPAPYLAAADRLGLDPAACVAVEDTPTGVASARAAGCSVLAVPSTVPIARGSPTSCATSPSPAASPPPAHTSKN